MNRVIALVNLFRKGVEVSRPGAWKNAQILAGLIMAIAMTVKAWGYDTYLTEEQALSIAVGTAALADVILTLITSKKVGILPPEPAHNLPEIVDPAPGEGHDITKGV